jgi:hypothetical protein
MMSALVFLLATVARAQIVTAGFDLLKTTDAHQDFSFNPIPMHFFGNGSDPFVGVVELQPGFSVAPFSACPTLFGSVDTIIQRPFDAYVEPPQTSQVIPIELVQLSLMSAQPIVVTYNNGSQPEEWRMHVSQSPTQPSTGSMRILHSYQPGGYFECQLRVYPKFTFTRVSDNAVRVLDGGVVNIFNDYAAIALWAYSAFPIQCVSCGGTNFFPGVRPGETEGGDGVFPWTCESPNAHQTLEPACPTEPLGTVTSTWGGVKSLYR